MTKTNQKSGRQAMPPGENYSVDPLNIDQIAPAIKNQLNFILGNAQILMDIWKEINKILIRHADEFQDIWTCGLPFKHIDRAVLHMLTDIKDGSLKIDHFVKILAVLESGKKTCWKSSP